MSSDVLLWTLGSGTFARRKRSAPDSFEPEAHRSFGDGSPTPQPAPVAPRNVQQRRNPVNHTDLASVLELIEEVDNSAHTGVQHDVWTSYERQQVRQLQCRASGYRAGLCDILRNHTYVGMADDTLALVQHQTKLYLVNAHQLSCDMFCQQVSGRCF